MHITHQTISTNGINLHVAAAGDEDAPLVILLHGFPEFWRGWDRQISALVDAGYRVWVPDQRGYNISDKPNGIDAYTLDELALDIVGLLDAAGVERAPIIGHDWGGAVTWWLALQHSQRLARTAVLNMPHPGVMLRFLCSQPRQLLKSWYMFFFQLPWLPERMLQRSGTRMLRATGHAFRKMDLQHYRDAYNQPGAATGMLNWYRAMLRRSPKPPPSPRVETPTLMIWGEQDVALDARMAALSMKYVADGRLVTLPDASHFVQHDAPEQVNDLLIDWLGSDESGGSECSRV
ncbi:MAG: alpha/beta hydrolase [Caldilineaceae bacterium]|nr:alpha/beta hydrolase [Caldilineaceae bacterium]